MNADQRNEMAAELEAWWADTATLDAEKVIPKAAEYGSGDLKEIGQTMAKIAKMGDLSEAQATELGIYYYVVGKLARWTSAIERGDQVSDDTLLDLTTYLMMVRRTRDAGGWPGVSISEASDGISEGLKTGPGVLAPIRRSEATEDPTTCPECGCARDTANHEYGCKGDRA